MNLFTVKVPTWISTTCLLLTLSSGSMFLEIGHKVLGIEPTLIPTYEELPTVAEETGEISCSWDSPPSDEEWTEVKMTEKIFALDPGQAKNDRDPDYYGLYQIDDANDIHVNCVSISQLPIIPDTAGFVNEMTKTLYINFGTPYGGVLHPGTKVLIRTK